MKPLIGVFVLFSGIALMGASSCEERPQQTPNKNEQAEKARLAAESIHFTDNAEIDNIKKRLELTSQPGLLGFIVLLDGVGRPIVYEAVKGKVTSGGKRLTDPRYVYRFGNGNGGTAPAVTDSPSDEGTYGSSGEYIYYWTPNGEYRQWSGKYLYSDKPFRLNAEPLVIGIEQK